MLSYGESYESFLRSLKDLLGICNRLKVDTVAGPVASGAIIASACFVKANLNAICLGKRDYRRLKRIDCPQILGKNPIKRILIVDDIIESGDSILYAYWELKESYKMLYALRSPKVVGCAADIVTKDGYKAIRKKHPLMKVFTLRPILKEMCHNEEKII